MLKSQASGLDPHSVISQFQQSVAQWVRSVAVLRLAPLSCLTVFGLAGISWVSIEAIAPQLVQAYTARVNVALNREPTESYRSFIRRAEAVARAAAQRSFDRDILVTDVAVTIVGQNDGAIVPLLSLAVTRQAWSRRPDPQRWATYFPDTQSLLRIGSVETDSTVTPQPPNPAATPAENTPPRVIELPGGVRLIPNPSGTPQQTGAPNQGTPQQTGAPNQGTPANGASPQGTQQNNAAPQNSGTGTQQNNAAPNPVNQPRPPITAPANPAAPNNAPAPPNTAPGQVIQLPGGVRLIPNPLGNSQ